MSRSRTSRFQLVLTAYFAVILALGIARFGSTPENLRYQLLLLLIPAAGLASIGWARSGRKAPVLLILAGVALLLQAAFQPTTEARGYVLAAIGWLGLLVTLWLGSRRRLLRTIFLVLLVIGAAEALYGLAEAIAAFDQIDREPGRLATGTFVNRNHFAGLLNMTLGLALGALYIGFDRRRRRDRGSSEAFAWTWLVVLGCAALGLAVFLSLSRTASLILLAMLVFVFLLLQLRGRRRRRQALPARVALLLLVATLGLGSAYGIGTLLARFETLDEAHRPQVYRETLQLIADHPWTGVGPGMYGYRFRAYQTVNLAKQYSQAHNDFLQVAAEWGVPMALVFWGFVLWVFQRSVRLFLSNASPWRQGIGLGCAAAILSILLHSMVDFNLQIPANLLFFSTILGLALAAEPPRPSAVRPRAVRVPAWLTPVLLLGLLPLALIAAAWRIVPRYIATQIAFGTTETARLELAAEWDPENPDYPYLLGRYYRDVPGLRDLETARFHSERAAQLAPWGWRAHWQLAQLYELLGDRPKAEEALRRTTELNPRDPKMQWRLANHYVRTGELERMVPPLAAAVAGDRSLLDPALGLLLKTGADLDSIESVWPTGPADRLVLLQGLVRRRGEDQPADPGLEEFLLAEWNRLLADPEPPAVREGTFFIGHLVDTGSLDAARRAWIQLAEVNGIEDPEFQTGDNLLWNGRFELPLSRSPIGWRINERPGFTAAVAPGEGVYDSAALRIDFDGSKNLELSSVRQTVFVAPGEGHELTYQARSAGLTTDQGVLLEVVDPVGRRLLWRSEPLLGTSPWSRVLASFDVPAETDRIEVSVRRLRSRQIDNRLAGSFWLDNVSVAKPVR